MAKSSSNNFPVILYTVMFEEIVSVGGEICNMYILMCLLIYLLALPYAL